LKLLEKNF